MPDILKQALPYVLMALLALWALSLQKEISALEASNASLSSTISELTSVAEMNDKAVVEWAEVHDANVGRMEHIHAEIGKIDDHLWGDARLPGEYVRVLREAGIFDPGCDAPVDIAAGSGNTEAEGHDEQGSAGVRARR